jgi:hypothetical protein
MLPLCVTACVVLCGAIPVNQEPQPAAEGRSGSSLEATRMIMGKWIETQQIISKERKDWQQGKEILLGRVELVKREIAHLEGKIAQAATKLAEVQAKRTELLARGEQAKTIDARLTEVVTRLEGDVRRLFPTLPEPIQTKLQPLYQRIPVDPANTKATAAERYQNVLVILGDLNKANNEITVAYEVRTLASGKPSEVQVIYVGLAHAYYVSAGGEAGIGRPGEHGWQWEASKQVAPDVLKALEIIQGKHTPAFVPLPVRIQ